MGIIFIIILVMFAPPIVFMVLGKQAKPNKQKTKIYYIIAVVYLIVGLGICGTILNGF